MRLLLSFLPTVMLAVPVFSQNLSKKPLPPATGHTYSAEQLRMNRPDRPAVPLALPPLQLPTTAYRPLPALTLPNQDAVRITAGENGLPVFFYGTTSGSTPSADRSTAANALRYLASLQPPQLRNPETEFQAVESHTDEQGNLHVRLAQQYNGIPVYGGEVIAHTRNGLYDKLNGRYFPTPQLDNLTPSVTAEEAVNRVKKDLNVAPDIEPAQLPFAFGKTSFEPSLIIYHIGKQLNGEHLAWQVEAKPNALRRYRYFIDAHTGDILNFYDYTCQIDGGRCEKAGLGAGPVTLTGLDLLGVQRSVGGWEAGGVYYFEDASLPMFNSAKSNMPSDPTGVLVTLNAFNTSPEVQTNFKYDFITANSTNVNNPAAISAHWNSLKSYQYYRSTFNRNAIDGQGSNILSFVNVSDADGSSLGNAFWNGDAMWYGNGNAVFKPLARGLDVGGHEMTHGVVERTANLEYQDESGALNESFADVFGVMIDRDDWKIGEDVMQPGVSPGNTLRSLEDPHNSAPSSSPFWQPRHVNEKYNGPDDNGGVHINSGIPNYAFYKFATAAGMDKNKAEQVYYKALRDYLVKSSQFVDARLAVIQAANDLYGSTVANAAAAAFDAVGIVGNQPGGNYLGQLAVNPGFDLIACVNSNSTALDLATGTGQVLGTLYNEAGIASRPSVSDDGEQIVFVNSVGNIIYIDINYNTNPITFQYNELSNSPIWRNTAISKDGRFLAAVTKTAEPWIYIYDLLDPLGSEQAFKLYNPTYSTGQITGDVRYADVLEFDYSGQFLMYDAFNALSTNPNDNFGYWDINFIQFWENGTFVNGQNAFISKLFNSIPENTSIGNATFAKNSPFVIAFDLIDEGVDEYYVLGANVETGDYNVIVNNNGGLGWPSYNRLDTRLLYASPYTFGVDLALQPLASTKIQSQGASLSFLDNYAAGVWFANGKRSLSVSANEPATREQHLRLNPNPTANKTTLQFSALRAMDTRVELLNTSGKTMLETTVSIQPGANILDIDLGNLPAGLYYIRVAGHGTAAIVKL